MKPRIKSKFSENAVECLLCYELIDVGVNPKLDRFITCKNCDGIFEIINLDPIMIDWPYYDDDYDDDDDIFFD